MKPPTCPECGAEMRQAASGAMFTCSACPYRTHPRACVDPIEGTIDCTCGLDDYDQRRAEAGAP